MTGVRGRMGSIPAGAGEPLSSKSIPQPEPVYPRGCGGTGRECRVYSIRVGLSPRVRGNLALRSWTTGKMRSIPAGAGEPSRFVGSRRIIGVYPRGCGGTPPCLGCPSPGLGLSPRVRGNRPGHKPPSKSPGSIPAGAGEPASKAYSQRCSQVYPRGCGGTDRLAYG